MSTHSDAATTEPSMDAYDTVIGNEMVGLSRYKGAAILGGITGTIAVLFGGISAWVFTKSLRSTHRHAVNSIRSEMRNLKDFVLQDSHRIAQIETRLRGLDRATDIAQSEQRLLFDRLRRVTKQSHVIDNKLRSASVPFSHSFICQSDMPLSSDDLSLLHRASTISLAHISSTMEELQVRGVLPALKGDRRVEDLRNLAMRISAKSDSAPAQRGPSGPSS